MEDLNRRKLERLPVSVRSMDSQIIRLATLWARRCRRLAITLCDRRKSHAVTDGHM